MKHADLVIVLLSPLPLSVLLLMLFQNAELKAYSRPDETREDF